MGQYSGRNLYRIKDHNNRAILLSLLQGTQISRAGLARQLSLSSATITNLVNKLIAQGIVSEIKPATSDLELKRAVGRPQKMIRLNPYASYAIGVHIDGTKINIVITNLFADIIDILSFDCDLDSPAIDVLWQVTSEIDDLLQKSAIDYKEVLGVGVGISGFVDHERGLLAQAHHLDWENTYAQDILQQKLRLPVLVENDVRAMALGESYFGAGRGVKVLAFIHGNTSVDAGFIVNGQIFRGEGVGGNTLGHTILVPDGGQRCSCGRIGCLDTLVTAQAIESMASEIAQGYPDQTIDSIFDAARQGDQAIKALISQQFRYLGIALANLVNILNPGMILLGGIFAQGNDLILPVVEEVMHESVQTNLLENVVLEPSSFDQDVGAIGAASLALMGFFYQNKNP